MSRIQFSHSYEDIISVENLLEAWKEFKRGKSKKEGVQRFQLRLMEYILALHSDLRNKTYRHGPYKHFKIAAPKPRDIHKASVRDRLLHHAIYRKLYPFFGRTFIADSFSCRIGKGTHKAMNRFRAFAYKVSKNHRRTCFVLKCDIRKFFANIDHDILFSILSGYIPDTDILALLKNIVGSFGSFPHSHECANEAGNRKLGVGLPLGNLTSQLLVNIYMNEFDRPHADFEAVPIAFFCPLYSIYVRSYIWESGKDGGCNRRQAMSALGRQSIHQNHRFRRGLSWLGAFFRPSRVADEYEVSDDAEVGGEPERGNSCVVSGTVVARECAKA